MENFFNALRTLVGANPVSPARSGKVRHLSDISEEERDAYRAMGPKRPTGQDSAKSKSKSRPNMDWSSMEGNTVRNNGFSDDDLEVHKYGFIPDARYRDPIDGGRSEYSLDDIVTGMAINGFFDDQGIENRSQRMYDYGFNPERVQSLVNEAYARGTNDKLSRAAMDNFIRWSGKNKSGKEKSFPDRTVIYDDYLGRQY